MLTDNVITPAGSEMFGRADGLIVRARPQLETAPAGRQEIVGRSPLLRDVLQLVELVGVSTATVLVTGETGTGKELVARAIHDRSPRRHRPFVVVNCGAIPPSLAASELFGHERGAFTGALQRRIGRFEQAAGGTLFLDEIGELPLEIQTALLRVLQEREFERVGGGTSIRADIRLVAATNRRLEDEVAAGRFRADLFYRLNVVPIGMPALRERREDIPLLVQHFVERCARASGRAVRRLDEPSMLLLEGYDWPGNVRELQNIVERAVVLARGDTATVEERWLSGRAAETTDDMDVSPAPGMAFADRLNAKEKLMIEAALRETLGRISGPHGAAARLKLPASTLESKIRALGIDKCRFKRSWGPES